MSSSRRGFLGMLAAWAGAVAVPTTTPAPSPSPSPTPSGPTALQTASRERFGKFLTAEELPMLDERIASIERRGARLRAYALENSDEPAADFSAARR